MEITEAILSRTSIRAYKPDPIPKEVLKELLEISIHAPSGENNQPWEFAIVGGKVMDKLKQVLSQKRAAGVPTSLDIGAPNRTGKYLERARENGRQLFGVLGITREDKESREQWRLYGTRFFDAPNSIIIYIDRALGTTAILDIGIIIQTIMLAAQSYGLGTCAQYQVVAYPREMGRILNIPESKLIVCGLSIGYPEMEVPQNKFRSLREPLEALAVWHGFDDSSS